MTMSNEDIYTPLRSRSGPSSRTRAAGRGPVIDQEGREIPDASLRTQFEGLRFDFGHSAANPFGDLTRFLARPGFHPDQVRGHASLENALPPPRRTRRRDAE